MGGSLKSSLLIVSLLRERKITSEFLYKVKVRASKQWEIVSEHCEEQELKSNKKDAKEWL